MQLYTSTYPMAYNMQYRQYCFAGHSILCTSYNIQVNSVQSSVWCRGVNSNAQSSSGLGLEKSVSLKLGFKRGEKGMSA